MSGSDRSRTKPSDDSTTRCSWGAAEPDGPPRSLYVHVPFCTRRCAYCDFATAVWEPAAARRYLARLREELCLVPQGAAMDTVYLGGGTPSALPPAELEALLQDLAARIQGPVAEWTTEMNPETVTRERLRLLRQAGVGRVSLGNQSFQPRVLQALGREHDPDHTRRALELLGEEGFSNVSVDLMFAAPGETEAELLADLEELAGLHLSHVSAYCLTFEEGTPLTRHRDQGRVLGATDDTQLAQYRLVREGLEAAGVLQYEISNFARPGAEARHNQVYWEGLPYYGIGLGAGSYVDGVRRTNTRELREYLEPWTGPRPPHESERLDARARAREMTILSLRMVRGLDEARLQAWTGLRLEDLYQDQELERLQEQGLVRRREGRLQLTERGLELSDSVFLELV